MKNQSDNNEQAALVAVATTDMLSMVKESQELRKKCWITEAYLWLCVSQGKPEDLTETWNLFSWAEGLYDGEEYEGMTPKEAVEAEISAST